MLKVFYLFYLLTVTYRLGKKGPPPKDDKKKKGQEEEPSAEEKERIARE
jgi:hypothetical protein